MRAAAAGAATGERSQSVNRRVFQDDVRKDAHLLLHCGERKVLIALDHSAETAGILLGEEARIYGEEKVGAENRSSKGRSENQQLAAKNPPQGNIVNVNQSVERTLKESVDPVVASGLVFQKAGAHHGDRKSTRLNSSHPSISYAVFCLKKKENTHNNLPHITTNNT